MKTLVARSIVTILLAGIYFIAWQAFIFLAFVFSFSSPKGGDAGFSPSDKQLYDCFLRIIEAIGWIFGFPAGLLISCGVPIAIAGMVNSLIYAAVFVWVGEKMLIKYKKSNKTMELTIHSAGSSLSSSVARSRRCQSDTPPTVDRSSS